MIIIIATDHQCCNQDGTSPKVILFYVDSVKKTMWKFVSITPSEHLIAQRQQWKQEKSVWNLFQVGNKDTRTMSHTILKQFKLSHSDDESEISKKRNLVDVWILSLW